MSDSLIQAWGNGLNSSINSVGVGTIQFLPKIIVAIIIFIAGWAVGVLIGRVVDQIVKSMKFDKVLAGARFEEVLSRAGFTLNSGAFLGGLVKWFVIVIFLVAAFDVLGLAQVNLFLQDVVLVYLPQVIAAVLILLIAAVIADAMQKVVVGSAKAAEIISANLLGAITKYSIWIFAILIALSQLGIAPQFMYTLFTGIVAMLALAGGLAFGLGGRDAATQYIEKIKHDISSNKH